MAQAPAPEVRAFADVRADVQNLVANAGGALWDSMPSHDEADVPDFLDQLLPLLESGQHQVIALTDAFVGLRLERPPFGIDPAPIIAEVRGDIKPEEVYHRPFRELWWGLSRGKLWEVSAKAARARLLATIKTDIMLATRGAMAAVEEADPDIIGFSRVVHGTCDLCEEAIGDITGAVRFPVHPGCECVGDPVTKVRKAPGPLTPKKYGAGRMLKDFRAAVERNQPDRYSLNEIEGMYRYFAGDESFALNQALRKEISWEDAAAEAEEAADFTRDVESMTSMRDGLDSAMLNAGPIGQEVRVYRALTRGAEQYGIPAGKDAKGFAFTDEGFGSTTTSKAYAEEFANTQGSKTFMQMDIDPEVKALFGGNPSESELLLERDLRYVVKNVVKRGEFTRVEVEVKPPGIGPAELKPKAPPAPKVSLSTHGSMIKTFEADSWFVRNELRQMERMPSAIMERLQKADVKVQIGDRKLTNLPGGKGLETVQPRGWSAGSTFKQVGGVYRRDFFHPELDRMVMVAGGGSSASTSTILHELGHAIEDMMFKTAHSSIESKLIPIRRDFQRNLADFHEELYNKLATYYRQGGPRGEAGMSELWAESTADVLMDEAAAVRKYSREYVAWVKKMLDEAAKGQTAREAEAAQAAERQLAFEKRAADLKNADWTSDIESFTASNDVRFKGLDGNYGVVVRADSLGKRVLVKWDSGGTVWNPIEKIEARVTEDWRAARLAKEKAAKAEKEKAAKAEKEKEKLDAARNAELKAIRLAKEKQFAGIEERTISLEDVSWGDREMKDVGGFGKFKASQHPLFTSADQEAIADYVGTGEGRQIIESFDANTILRGSTPKVEAEYKAKLDKFIADLDKALEHAGPIGERTEAWRGIDITPGDLVQEYNVDSIVGQTITDDGFGSLTSDIFSAGGYAPTGLDEEAAGTIFHLNVSPELKAIWGANPTESELIIGRGCRYVVKSVHFEREGKFGQWIIEADLLPPS